VAQSVVERIGTLEAFPHLGRSGRVEGTRESAFPPLPFVAIYEIRNEEVVLHQDVPEAHFAIGIAERPASGQAKLRGLVTSPTSGSIQQRLLQLHMTNRDLSLDALLPRVTIQRQTIVEDRCPSIRSRMNALASGRQTH